MKKRLSALLVFALVLGLACPALAEGQGFGDVSAGHWAYSYIQSAADDGVMNGTGGGMFSPGKTLTRAEFIVMMMRAFYADEVTAREAELKADGIETTWYTAHCVLAYEKGLLESASMETAIRDGVGKLKNPSSFLYQSAKDLSEVSAENIARIDMAVIAGRIMLKKGVPAVSDADYQSTLNKIPDVDQISNAQRETMATVYYYGVITGIDANGTFNPSGNVDRASASAIYCRLRDCVRDYGTETPVPAETPAPTPSARPVPVLTTNLDKVGQKAPYATTENSIVGMISDSRVTLSLDTHKAPVDYWSNTSPEVQALTDKDAYNAIVFTMLNREWLAENDLGLVATRQVPDNYNYPCFQDLTSPESGRDPKEVGAFHYAISAMYMRGYVYRTGRGLYKVNTESDKVDFFYVGYEPIDDIFNGAFVPIFAKFTPNMSDKDKIVIMVEALCERMEYSSEENSDLPFFEWGSDSGGFSGDYGRGACGTYANNFLQICRAAGIPCMVCIGNNHAWNLVYADREWYVVDAQAEDWITFDKEHLAYTLISEERMAESGFSCDMSNEKLIIEALYKDVYGE